MAKVNDAQRMANAKLFGTAIKKVETLAPKLAQYYKQEEERQDKILRNEMKLLVRQTGLTWQKVTDYNKYNKDKEDYIEDVGLYEREAARLEALPNNQIENRDLARDLRGITGNRARVLKEVLVGKAASGWGNQFLTDASTFTTSVYKREDGTALSYANVESAEELKILLNEYHTHIGLNDIDDADVSNEYLNDEYWPRIRKAEESIISTWSTNKYNLDQTEKLGEVKSRLGAAKGSDNIGALYLELVNNNPALFKSGAKAGVLDEAFKLYETGQLDLPDLIAIRDHVFLPRGSKQEKTVGEHFDAQFGDFDTRIEQAQTKRLQSLENSRLNKGKLFVLELRQKVEERGYNLTEAEYVEARDTFRKLHGYEPESLKIMGRNTTDDIEDDAIIEGLNYKLTIGLAVSDDEVRQIQDKTKRDNFMKLDRTGIENVTVYGKRITALTDEYFQVQTGEAPKTELWYQTEHLAKASFKSRYAQLISNGTFPPTAEGRQKAREMAYQETKDLLNAGAFSQPSERAKVGEYSLNMSKAQKGMSEAKKQGNVNYVENTIIPGTEKALRALENFKPGDKIPDIYYGIALDHKRLPGKDLPATAWEIANAQYKLATGKELPKTKEQLNVESVSNVSQYLVTYRRTNSRVRQAQVIEQASESANTDQIWNGQNVIWFP